MANRKQIQLKDLEAGAVYTLQIRAVDNLGTTSPWSPKITIETIEDTTAPNAPSGLTWQVSGDDFVATWTEPTLNEDGSVTEDLKDYKVTLYDPAVPGTQKHYYTASERFEFSFAQNKAAFGAPEKRLTIEVRSRDLGGNTSATPTSKTAENGAPGNFTLDAVGERKAIVLNWDSPADYGDVATANPVQNGLDILEFDIYRGGVLIGTVAGNTYTYNDSDPGRGDHTYFIRARDVYGGETDSNTDTASASGYWEEDTVAPAPPTLVSGTPTYALIDDGLEVEASFSWNAPTTNADATPYEDHEAFQIRYGKNSSGPWQYIEVVDTRTNGTDAQQFTENIDGLDPGTTYYWGVRARDRYQNYSTWATTNKDAPADTTAPNTPSTPTASGSTNYILVSHDMLDNVGVELPRDVAKLEVYISETGAGFTADASNKEGEIDVIPGIPAVQSFSYPVTDANESGGTVDVWVKVKAVDIAGNVSSASAAGQVDVNLIENVNILDATIEAAKIGSVFANSIVAGTGLINDLTVKANLTLGDNVTDGVIQSYPYTQDPSTGFYMDDIVGLIVNDGKISAGALEIHDSPNLVDAGYADFEYAESWYVANMNSDGPTSFTTSSDSRYRAQSLQLDNSADTTASSFYLSKDSATFNIPVEGGKTYIASVYANPTSAVAVTLGHMEDTGPVDDTASGTLTANSWAESNRISHVFTTGATTTSILLYVNIPAGAVVKIDGVQVEEKVGNSNEPSFFKIGGATTIDGGNLSTGTIDANKVSLVGTGSAGRVEIDGTGIYLFDAVSGGNATASLDTDLGYPQLKIGQITLGYDVYAFDSPNWDGLSLDRSDTGANNVFMYNGADRYVFRTGQKSSGGNYLEFDSSTGLVTVQGAIHVDDSDTHDRTDYVPGSTVTNLTGGSKTTLTDDAKAIGSAYATFTNGGGTGTGTEGNNYVQFDFGEVKDISSIWTYWYTGDDRYYWYKIKYSLDGTNWFYARGGPNASVGLNGWVKTTKRSSTSGEHPTVDRFQPRIAAKYIRVYGDGSTSNAGNHLYEVEIFAQEADGYLTVGENFRVDSSGSLWANNGNFTGTVAATGGSITGDLTVTGKLTARNTGVGYQVWSANWDGLNLDIANANNVFMRDTNGRILLRLNYGGTPSLVFDTSGGVLSLEGGSFVSGATDDNKVHINSSTGGAGVSITNAAGDNRIHLHYNAQDALVNLRVWDTLRIIRNDFSPGSLSANNLFPEGISASVGKSHDRWDELHVTTAHIYGTTNASTISSSGTISANRLTQGGTHWDSITYGSEIRRANAVIQWERGRVSETHDALIFGGDSIEITGHTWMNNMGFYMRAYPDANHGIWFDSGVNGVRVQGYRGVDLWVDNYDTRLTVQTYARVTNKANSAYKQLYADVVDQSDRRWKRNIQPLDSALDTIRNWEVSTYEHYGQPGRRAGLMADTMPENIVAMGELNHPETGEKIETYGYRPTAAIAYLVKAVQELSEEVERLRGE